MKTTTKTIIALALLASLCSCDNDEDRFQMSNVTQPEHELPAAYLLDTEEGTVWLIRGTHASLVKLPRLEE